MQVPPIIEVVPYDPNWPRQYEQEAEKLKGALGPHCVRIYHIGSTAVLGMKAKPVIDILVVVRDIFAVDALEKEFCDLGYTPKGENGIPFRRYFEKGDSRRTHHVHVFEEGSPEIDMHLKFVDCLRSEPETRQEYESLKERLAKKFPHDRVRYVEGKEDFIQKILKKFPPKLRLVLATTTLQWDFVAQFRKKVHLAPLPDKQHHHMLLMLGAQPIGYSELADTILCIAMEPGHEQFHTRFEELLTRWLTRPK